MPKTTPIVGLLLCGAALSACGRRVGDASQESAQAAQGLAADTTPPTVVSTSPENGATGAGINGLVVATFSEPMNGSSINANTFTVVGPAGLVLGRVAFDATSQSAAFVPAALLATNALYTATITTWVKDQAGNFLRGAVAWTFTTARDENTPTTVVSTLPANGATLAPNSSLVATFSEPMKAQTLTNATFTVTATGGANAIDGTVQYDGASRSAIFSPAAALVGNTSYTATLTTGVQDVSGNALTEQARWTFTTETDPDATQPTVSSTAPSGSKVPGGAPITATFSEPVDPRTITATTFTVQGVSGAVSGTVSYDPASRTATFTPASALSLGAAYTAHILDGMDGVKDLAGNVLAAPAAWAFTLAVRYSGFVSNRYEDKDWHVRTNANAWWGNNVRNDRGLRLAWAVAQQGDHWQYAYHLYGAEKAVNKWVNGFGIETPNDFAATDLLGGWSLVEPVNGVRVDGFPTDGVLTDVTSTLTRPSSAQQYTAATGLVTLHGIRWYMAEGNFQTDVPNTMFILTFSTRRAPAWGDVILESPVPSGGGMPTAWNWHLGDWTGAAVADGNNGGWVLVPGVLGADTEQPYALSVQPADGSVGLGVHDSIQVSLSEAADSATVDTAAFTLQDGSGVQVSGTVTYDPLAYVARFTPSSPLSYSSSYSAILSGVSDLAGHAMVPVAWTFTTEAPDTILPRVLSTSPQDAAAGVAVGAAISARFSEAVDVSNLATAFTVNGVPGTVTYASATNTAVFAPSAPLAYDTPYTAIISGIADLTGNVMLGSYRWSFATASPPPYVPTGDVNGDGIVDVQDAKLALWIAAHEVTPTAEQLRAGDAAPLVNGVPSPDGKIDVGDALVILSKIAGKVSW
jgi:hypothetical protein